MLLVPRRVWLAGFLLLVSVACAREDDPELLALLDRYEESRGGVLKLEALGALRIEGATRQQGQAYTFTLYKKRPGLVRFRMERGEEAVILGYDGSTAWKRVLRDGDRITEKLGPDEASLLSKEAALHDPLARALESYSRNVRYMGDEQLEDGRTVHVLEVNGPWKVRSIFYLDAGTLDIIRSECFDDRGGQLLETLYSSYQEVDGYRFAYRIENRIEGETISETALSTIEVNPGVLNFYFRPPL